MCVAFLVDHDARSPSAELGLSSAASYSFFHMHRTDHTARIEDRCGPLYKGWCAEIVFNVVPFPHINQVLNVYRSTKCYTNAIHSPGTSPSV